LEAPLLGVAKSIYYVCVSLTEDVAF